MASMTLEELSEKVSTKYAPFDIPMGEAGTCRLRQALMLPKEQKRELIRIQTEMNKLQETKKDENGEDVELSVDEQMELEPKQIELFKALFRIVAEDQELIEAVLAQIGDSLVHLNELFEAYQGSSELGEASASPSS